MAASYITDFIQSLNPEEILIVREYFSIRNSKIKEQKVEKLFEIIIKDPDKIFTDDALCKLLHNNSGAIRVLKSRLFDIIEEVLTSTKHFENTDIFDERETAFYSLKKKVLLAKSIFRTSHEKRVIALNKLILEVVEVATEYQFYDILTEILIIQKHSNSRRRSLSDFNKTSTQIVFYDNCYKAVQNACDEFFRVIINQNSANVPTKKQRIQTLKKSITQLEKDYQYTKAEEVNYYRHILILALLEFENNYKEAIIWCLKLLAIVKTNRISFSRKRIGYALGNLSIFHIYIAKFNKAIIYAQKARQYHIPNTLDYTNIKELEFLANFYNRRYVHALKVLNDLLGHSLSDIGKFQASLYKYYEAYITFCNSNYKETLQLLNKSLEIEKDKASRNISLRILLIMTFIKLDKKNEASTAIASLRKHIERNSKTKEIQQRDILIYKLLRELEKDEFKRNEKNIKANKLLQELSDKNGPTAWNYFTPELIPFHEWVLGLPVKIAKEQKTING